jgi:hypothetical protein
MPDQPIMRTCYEQDVEKLHQLRNQQSCIDETTKVSLRASDIALENELSTKNQDELEILYGTQLAKTCAGISVDTIRVEFWEPLLASDFDSVEEDSGEESLSPLLDMVDEKTLFNPKEIVSHLLQRQRDSLEHLVFSVRPCDNPMLILRQRQLVDLKGFSKLACLDIDTLVLRTVRGLFKDIPPRGIPRSLDKVLPNSVQLLRLTIRHGRFQNIPLDVAKVTPTESSIPQSP